MEQVERLQQTVADSLMKRYESSQLPGKTMEGMIAKYKSVKIDPVKRVLWVLYIFIVFLVVIGTTSVLVTGKDKPSELLIVTLLVGGVMVGLRIVHVYLDHCDTQKKMLNNYESAFEKFISTLNAVNPMRAPVHEYTEKSIRGCLVELAYNILYAEKQLDEVRLHKERMTEEILHRASALARCNHEFENALTAASKFGLKFKRSELFDSAKTLPSIAGSKL